MTVVTIRGWLRCEGLDARRVNKTFSGRQALVNFDLQIGTGEVHAVVGETVRNVGRQANRATSTGPCGPGEVGLG